MTPISMHVHPTHVLRFFHPNDGHAGWECRRCRACGYSSQLGVGWLQVTQYEDPELAAPCPKERRWRKIWRKILRELNRT